MFVCTAATQHPHSSPYPSIAACLTHLTVAPPSPPLQASVSASPATDASIDAKLQAEAQAIPADLELVPSLLFPANARGPLETP